MNCLNAKGKSFSWSFSALSEFESCPARYAAKRFYCTTVEAETEQLVWGTRVHKAFEERIRDGKPFPEDFPTIYEPWARTLEKLPGEKHFERKFAVKRNHQSCDWFEGVGRGVVDLLILNGEAATIIDYKTGKKKDDQTQLELFAWFVANEYQYTEKKLETFKYRYIWLKDNSTTGGELRQIDALLVMNRMLPRIEAMERAWKDESFPCFPSGLCGWCPVSECIHWRERKEWR
jgi:RecB family exonuclease